VPLQFAVDPQVLVGFCLVMVRATAWVSLCPPFNSPSIPKKVRLGFAVAMSFALARSVGTQVTDIAVGSLVGALATEVLAGLALGAFVFVLFAAIQAAGELLDLQVGFSLGGVIDPISGNMAAPIGRLQQLLGVVLLFAINGHVLVVRAFVETVHVAPLGGVDTARLAEGLSKLLGVLLASSLEIALPVLTALFFTEVALGLLGKAAPQLNILVIGFALKTMIAFALLGATFLMLPETTGSLLGNALRSAGKVFTG
jgi:flagellar biosynthetic protein FliR